MADFKYKKHLTGKTVAMIELPATGTVEAGDLLDVAEEKADASSTAVPFLAMEGNTTGVDTLMLPLLNGTILEGVVNADGGISAGDSVGISVASNAQVLDEDASESLFIAMEDGAAGESINVLVTAGL